MSPFTAIHRQRWCPPASTSQEAALAAKVLASKPAAFLGGILLGVKEKAWPKYIIIFCSIYGTRSNASQADQHSMASGGLLLFATAQMVKGRPCLSANLENRLEAQCWP